MIVVSRNQVYRAAVSITVAAAIWCAYHLSTPDPVVDQSIARVIDLSTKTRSWSEDRTSSNIATIGFRVPLLTAAQSRVGGGGTAESPLATESGLDEADYPVPNITWIYDSGPALSADITMPKGALHQEDPVLYSSGASGVESHSVVNRWLNIESGRGNGRVYWNYHELPEFESMPDAGYNMAMTGTFKLTPGIENLSIKDGNHGTDGWIFEDSLTFGGFGLSIWRTRVQSKAEYWHNDQGKSQQSEYPDSLRLEDGTEYRYFLTVRTRPQTEEVVLNVWLDFGTDGWVHVMRDRAWGKDGWEPGDVPDGGDKTAILRGPYHIKRHHIWTRANGSGFLPVKDVRIGVLEPYL